jgi:hypothetical protein
MKSKEEIEQLALQRFPIEMVAIFTQRDRVDKNKERRKIFIETYTQCQEDTKQILLDFIKWSNAVDEYGNKLDEIDIDNFLNKQD